jgi:hypothetical protein
MRTERIPELLLKEREAAQASSNEIIEKLLQLEPGKDVERRQELVEKLEFENGRMEAVDNIISKI